jgi:hypothetical protein
MIDVETKKPLCVETDRTVGAYMRVSVPQLDAIRQLLERYKIGFRVDENAISINGGPEMTRIYLGRGADPHAVQTILDSAS